MSYWNITAYYNGQGCTSGDLIYYTIVVEKTNYEFGSCESIKNGTLSSHSDFISDWEELSPIKALEQYLDNGSESVFYLFDRTYEKSEKLIYAYVPNRIQSSVQAHFNDTQISCYDNKHYYIMSFGNNNNYSGYGSQINSDNIYCKYVHTEKDEDNPLQGGDKVGLVLGLTFGILLPILFICYYFFFRYRRLKRVVNGTNRSQVRPIVLSAYALPTIQTFPMQAPPLAFVNNPASNPDYGEAGPSAPPPPAYSEFSAKE